jgi:hypothetical protein
MLTDQIRELLEKRRAYLFHITSLQPSSEAGVSDTWEAMELQEFKKGKKEASEVVEVNNRRYHGSKGNTLPDIVWEG